MANESLRANVAQESAIRRVTDELLPRQAEWREKLGIGDNQNDPEPYAAFNGPMVTPDFMTGKLITGDSPDAPEAPDSVPGNALPTEVNIAHTFDAIAHSPLALVSPLSAVLGLTVAPAVMDSFLANQAQMEAQIPMSEFGPVTAQDSPAEDASSAMAVNGMDAASDAAAAAADGGGGGGAGGGKIVCTAMNQAYGFGSFRQSVWLEYSEKRLTKQHERGYHRIFQPLVRYAFHSGNSFAKRNVRQFLEYIMRLRTADLRAEMRGNNPHPIRRVIRRTCEYICYLAGKS